MEDSLAQCPGFCATVTKQKTEVFHPYQEAPRSLFFRAFPAPKDEAAGQLAICSNRGQNARKSTSRHYWPLYCS